MRSSDIATYGVFGLKTADGGYAVWQTSDSCKTFSAATGVEGVPTYITHVDDKFYMVTDNGHIELSADHGKTWTDVYTTDDGTSFSRIRFADADRGIALAGENAYITRDGGSTWTKTDILPHVSFMPSDNNARAASATSLLDAVWNDSTVFVVGTNNVAYCSKDDGNNFDIVRVDLSGRNNFSTIFYDRQVYNIIGDNGNFYRKSDITSQSGYCAGIYDVDKGSWSALQCSGQSEQNVFSSPYRISGDGNSVVGLAYFLNRSTNKIQAHAAIWNSLGIVDMGSKFANINRASRANVTNYDGSVVAGWQDVFGPWFASVWRRNADGTYTQTLLTKDSTIADTAIDYTSHDEMCQNLLGACQAMTPDGKYIGGNGGALYAVSGPWIWSKEEGLIQISDDEGCVADISNDGTKAVGWYGNGSSSAWIWIKGEGTFDLQSYVEQKTGADFGDYVICSVYDMSPNGRYLTGYCMKDYGKYAYVVDLEGKSTGIANVRNDGVRAGVQYDRNAGKVYVTLPADDEAQCSIFDVSGRPYSRSTISSMANAIDVSNVPEGLYLLGVKTKTGLKTYKIDIMH
jgi:photosystem II stability/assembly factor-like uncharacterized protein